MEFMKDIELISVLSGQSTPRGIIMDRPAHALVYRLEGETEYLLRQKRIANKAGTVLYLPQGESYSYRNSAEGGRYILINFRASCAVAPAPFLFLHTDELQLTALFKRIERLCRLEQSAADCYEALSLFYRLLSYLESLKQPEYTTSEKKEQISPAIAYLEQHLFDTDLTVSALPTLCGLSAPTFRQIFISRFHTTPRKYVIERRMRQAKQILESGEYSAIAEVALAVGYDDPLYFSKYFKSLYGTSPSQLGKV